MKTIIDTNDRTPLKCLIKMKKLLASEKKKLMEQFREQEAMEIAMTAEAEHSASNHNYQNKTD